MRTFRNILFWIHLITGIAAGIVIGIMSFTGVVIAFEKQIIEWAERDIRTVQVPSPGAARLPVEDLVERVRAVRTDGQPTAVTVFPDPASSVIVNIGRGSVTFIHPYTGEVLGNGAEGVRGFFRWNVELHRWLVASGDNRPVGKAITGASNAVFLFLAISGLYLWWPRKWTLRAMRPSLWFRRGLKGKARDWNWHNVIGFWTLPVIIVLAGSGMVISYKWASNLVFTVMGSPAPTTQGPPGSGSVKVPAPTEPTPRKPLDELMAEARKTSPNWEYVVLRLGGGNARPAGAQAPGGKGQGGREGAPEAQVKAEGAPADVVPDAQGKRGRGKGDADGVDAVSFSVREKDAWPLFSSQQVSLNPFTGEVAKLEGYADYNSGRKARSWLRFLHTGEALGLIGQLVAAIASLGGVFLTYTGFALAWRRFFPRRRRATTEAKAEPVTAESERAA
ncbi:putative iron-regulated membrane protein [Myxococcus hansupus]|uniref:Putative iron-regulated membrane protein n=1 Tax=Pseudomyxococcus hansupus TaxID=1297742 RepID=A0A0H4WWU8_9BACT|nr:PepSY-associated TM helix domain-containing protein [Myxococcus hansupus]AKQ66083.1 putative iron-regulated membrane protein [Myxococcus hansupus]